MPAPVHPVKFSLDGNQGSAILDGNPTLQRTNCTTGAAIGSPIATSGNLSYEGGTDTYKYTWKTVKAWSGWCGTLSLDLADGQSHELDVRFKARLDLAFDAGRWVPGILGRRRHLAQGPDRRHEKGDHRQERPERPDPDGLAQSDHASRSCRPGSTRSGSCPTR